MTKPKLEPVRAILVMINRDLDTHISDPDKLELPKSTWAAAVTRFEELEKELPPPAS